MKSLLSRLYHPAFVPCIILCVTLLLSSCSVFDIFDDGEDEDGTSDVTTSVNTQETPLFERNAGIYTFLTIHESADGVLSSLSVSAMNVTESTRLSMLQIPADLYINDTSLTLSSLYGSVYEYAVSDGDNTDRAKEKAVLSVKNMIEDNLSVDIDYYICMSSQGLSDIADNLGGIELQIPVSINLSGGLGTLSVGAQTLSGAQCAGFVEHPSFSALSRMDAYKMVIAGIYKKAKADIGNEVVSLFTLELKNAVVTDVPSENGEDIFFVRKFLGCDTDAFMLSNISTQSCALPNGKAEIMFRNRALSQINEFLALYKEPIGLESFDKQLYFNDSENTTVNAIYTSTGNAATSYTAKEINNGAISLSQKAD